MCRGWVRMGEAIMATLASTVEHTEGSFETADGLKLFSQHWEVKGGGKRAVLVVVHGLKDHSSRYTEFANTMASRGFVVDAFDLRGHGRSPGKRSYVGKFEDLVSDLSTFVSEVRRRNAGLPIFVFGHSMGGTTVALSIVMRAIDVKGVILSAAALAPGEGISPMLIRVTKFLGKVAPSFPLMSLPNKNFSRDPDVVAAMGSDPLIYQKNGPVRTAAELLSAMHKIETRAHVFEAPVLLLHGTADKLTNPAGSRKLADRASSTDKTLKTYQGLVHDLLHEPEKAQVIADIADWLDMRAPKQSKS